MRAAKLGWALAMATGLAACGPSAAHIRSARAAVYTCDYDAVWAELASEVKQRYPRAAAVAHSRKVVTAAYWHHADGRRYRPGVRTVRSDRRHTSPFKPGDREQMFQLRYTFELEQQGRGWQVSVQPSVWERHNGGTRVALAPDSADIPGWVAEHRDMILVDVHEGLGACVSSEASD